MNQEQLRRGRESLAWAQQARRQGRLEEATSAYYEALETFEQAGYSRGVLATLNSLATLAQSRGDPARAAALFEEALSRAEGSPADMALISGNLATLHLLIGDQAAAEAAGRRALDLYTRLGHAPGCGAALSTLARVATARGEGAAALELLEEAARCFESAGDAAGLGRALLALGSAAQGLGAVDRARGSFERAGELLSRAGDGAGTAHAVRGLGLVEQKGGHLDAAREKFVSALELFQQAADARGQAAALQDLGQLASMEGDLGLALTHLDRSVGLARAAGAAEEIARGQASRAQALTEQGDLEAAARAVTEAAGLFEQLGHAQGLVGCRIHRARLLLLAGDVTRADAELDVALQGARDAGLAPLIATATISRGRVLDLRGDPGGERACILEARGRYEAIGAQVEAAEADLLLVELDAWRSGVPQLELALADRRLVEARALFEARGDAAGLIGVRGLVAVLHRCHGAWADAEAMLRTQSDYFKLTDRRLAWLRAMGMVHFLRLRAGHLPRPALIEGLANESLTLGARLQGVGVGLVAAEAHVARGRFERARRSLGRWSHVLDSTGEPLPGLRARLLDVRARLALAEGDDAGARERGAQALALHARLEDAVGARELRQALRGGGASPEAGG